MEAQALCRCAKMAQLSLDCRRAEGIPISNFPLT